MKNQIGGCEEKGRLLQVYNDATREFSERVAALNAKKGTTPENDDELLERAVEDARLKSDRRALLASDMSPITAADDGF